MTDEVTSSIIESVADHKNVNTADLDIVLADCIDLDAVETLARHNNSTWRLQFELPKHSVTIKSNGEVLIDDHLKQKLNV